MTRRGDRRRHAIQRQLLFGPATVRDIARTLCQPQLLIWSDLEQLEATGTVVTVWVRRPSWPEGAIVAAYRLPTIAEQDAYAAENAAYEQRLRAAFRAAATHTTIPGEPS